MRRANGTGSIVNLGPNRRNRYAVRVSYLDRPGLWKQKYISYHRTAKEAQEALEQYLSANIPAQSFAVTLGDVYAQWSAKKYIKVGAASIGSYRASWARLSSLKDKEMCKVTLDDLQCIIDKDEAAGLSKSSISNDRTLMKALFKHAMERDIVHKDYSAFIEMPSVSAKFEKGAFDDLTMKKLEQLARSGFPWADTVLMLCYTGFRISEFLQLTKFSYHAEAGGYLQGGLKTNAGKNRVVPVHLKIKPYLENWLVRKGETIICDGDGAAISSDKFRPLFKSVVKELGVPQATPHWCRHTAASRMKMAGMDDLAIKRILGHSDGNVTEHYTHMDVEFLAKELQKVS